MIEANALLGKRLEPGMGRYKVLGAWVDLGFCILVTIRNNALTSSLSTELHLSLPWYREDNTKDTDEHGDRSHYAAEANPQTVSTGSAVTGP